MGIDFKTMGTIGQNVHAIEDGYLIRIKVEPGGYGQALYINHPNGYTSVYGHLERFSPEIEQYCREEQYAKKSFAVDIILPPGKIPIKKGQVIALSGNRGGSSGHIFILKSGIRNRKLQSVFLNIPIFLLRIILVPQLIASGSTT
jgi:murein DD-endopeptidase MepM/ murein hydrolase activator NlpD